MERRIDDPAALAPPDILQEANPNTVLQAANMANMIGVLQQLMKLATYSHKVFHDLATEADHSHQRLKTLKLKLYRVKERIYNTQAAIQQEPRMDEICVKTPAFEFKAIDNEASNLFHAASRPPALQDAFNRANRPPPLYLLDQFVDEDFAVEGAPTKHRYGDSCIQSFSDPHFFLKEWLDDEKAKRSKLMDDRRARRAARKSILLGSSQGAARSAKRVQKKRYMTEEEMLGIAAPRDGDEIKYAGHSPPLESHMRNLNLISSSDAHKPPPIPPPPPPTINLVPPPSLPESIPASSNLVVSAPPSSFPTPPSPYHVESQSGKSTISLSDSRLLRSTAASPEDLSHPLPHSLPPSQPSNVESPSIIPPPPPLPAFVVQPPPAPPLPQKNSTRSSTMAAAPPTMRPRVVSGGLSGNDALLEAIRGGAQLKRVSDRELKPAAVDARSNLMESIRGGANLKKVDRSQMEVKNSNAGPESVGGMSVASILARRAALAEESDDESDVDWD